MTEVRRSARTLYLFVVVVGMGLLVVGARGDRTPPVLQGLTVTGANFRTPLTALLTVSTDEPPVDWLVYRAQRIPGLYPP